MPRLSPLTTTLSTKGQVILSATIRRARAWSPGTRLVVGDTAEGVLIRAETMKTRWVPGVNDLGGWGRWAFAELTDPFAIQDEVGKIVGELVRR